MNAHRKVGSLLWLDDQRTPLLLGAAIVRSYEEFVAYFEGQSPDALPDVTSFDHDLSPEPYPIFVGIGHPLRVFDIDLGIAGMRRRF